MKTTSDAGRRRIMPRAPDIFIGTFGYLLVKPRRKFLLLAAACVFVSCATVFLLQRENVSSLLHHHPGLPAQDIRAGDRKFLDDLVQKQNQGGVLDGNSLSGDVQNIGKAGTTGSGDVPVPKAELVVNGEIVRRGELVVHGGTIKRAELVQPRH
jgi:hypothetical protein